MKILNKKLLKKNKLGFTLVELIIVITILAILAAIAFISFQGYSKNSRDGNRLTTMKNISKGLEIYKVQSGNYPRPDNSINVEASGTLIGYQGIVGDIISRNIKMNVIPTDPYDKEKYVYGVNSDSTKYEVLGYLETSDYLTLLNQSYALDYSNRYVKTMGDKVGIILNNDKTPITGTGINIATGSTAYNVYFGDSDVINGSGSVLFSNMSTRRSDLTNNKSLAIMDDSLVGYWDMETTTGGKLKDLSKYGNNGTLNGLVEVGGVSGVKGKSGLFKSSDWTNNTRIETSGYNSLFDISNGFTVNVWIKKYSSTASYEHRVVGNRYNWNDTNGWYITFPTSEKVAVSVGSMGSTAIRSNLKLDVGVWYNVLFTFYNGKTSIYINGEKQIQEQSGVIYNNTSYPLAIGGMPSAPNYGFDGLIDEIRIYNRTLSDSEIQELYNSTK